MNEQINSSQTRWPAWATVSGCLFFLVLYWCLAVFSKWDTCNTFDEISHLTIGTSFWVTHDFRLSPEAILLQRWAGLPVALGNYQMPDFQGQDWQTSQNWPLAFQFFFRCGNDADEMLRLGRMMMAFWGVVLGLVIFLWSRYLFGTVGGFLSLAAFTFCPTVLANGGLVNTDLGTALFFILGMTTLWIVLHRITPWTVLASGLAVGGLFVCKMSAVLIIPMGLLLIPIRLLGKQPMLLKMGQREVQVAGRLGKLAVVAGLVAAHILLAGVVIWAMFEFRYEPNRPGQGKHQLPIGSWEEILPGSSRLGTWVDWARQRRLLPEGYLYALHSSLHFTGLRRNFLNGEVGLVGWPSFFPYCFLVKTPLPIFLLLGLGAWAWVKTREKPSLLSSLGPSLYRAAPLGVLFVVYWFFAIKSNLNIGHRHILPIYPVVLIWVGAAGWWLRGLSFRPPIRALPLLGWLTLGSIAWQAGETLYRWPHYLAYFNQVVGGPANGYQHLVDSSLDWGQDLPGLRAWLEKNNPGNQEPVYLSYFGSADTKYYGIEAERLFSFFPFEDPPPLQTWKKGIYCISATMLQGVYTKYLGSWNPRLEKGYRMAQERVQAFLASQPSPGEGVKLLRSGKAPKQAENAAYNHDQYRFARLCHFLRQRRPDAMVGYSILIFRLDEKDLEEAQQGEYTRGAPEPGYQF
jgi:hypothetical protein